VGFLTVFSLLLAMVFKLAKGAERRWRKLKGAARLAQVIKGVRFKDGLPGEAQRNRRLMVSVHNI